MFALDSGARLGELCGLRWADVDVDTGKVSIKRKVVSPKLAEDGSVQFGPPKTGKSRTVDLNAETVALLRVQRRSQNELRMKHRDIYTDHGLVFATELGAPVQPQNVAGREFKALIKAADVKRITFHGLRHTSATLLLATGEPAKVVSERLGHASTAMTTDIYQHVLPTMGRAAADRLGALLHGQKTANGWGSTRPYENGRA